MHSFLCVAGLEILLALLALVYREVQGEGDASLNSRGHHYGREREPIGPQPPGRAGVGAGTGKEDDSNDLCTLWVMMGGGVSLLFPFCTLHVVRIIVGSFWVMFEGTMQQQPQ